MGGDLTFDSSRLNHFTDYIKNIGGLNLLIRGNHDDDLWSKQKKWDIYVTSDGLTIYNLDFDPERLPYSIPGNVNIIASHFVWFEYLLTGYSFANTRYGFKKIWLM